MLQSQQEIYLHQEILLSFQRLYQDENADSPCYRNQWSERYRVRQLKCQIYRHSSQRRFTVSACGCIVVMIKINRNNFIKVNVIFEQSKELRFVRFKIFLQSSKISAKESCVCGIIDMSPFGAWFMVSEQLHYITNREEILDFRNIKMPYSCGLWRFANT